MKLIRIITLLTVTGAFLLGMQSCKKKNKDTPSDDTVEMTTDSEDSENHMDFEKAKDCDDFIDQYEEWSEEFVAFLSKYKDDPVKAVTSPEYAEMMQRASSWSQQWLSLSVSCAQNSSYEKRVSEIADRMEEKVKELGFK